MTEQIEMEMPGLHTIRRVDSIADVPSTEDLARLPGWEKIDAD